jgi:hypothetical protein
VQRQSASSSTMSRAGLATQVHKSCVPRARLLRMRSWRPRELPFRVCAPRNIEERSRIGRAALSALRCAQPRHRLRESLVLLRRRRPFRQTNWRIRLGVELWNYRSPAISPFEGMVRRLLSLHDDLRSSHRGDRLRVDSGGTGVKQNEYGDRAGPVSDCHRE